MNIIAIETSLPQASLCLFKDGAVVFSTSWNAIRNHDSFLFPALKNALEILGNNTLDYVIVGAGPGSYGGVRVALAAAVGIATVRAAKVVALCSWHGLAAEDVAIISDARRGGWTVYRGDTDIQVLSTEELQQSIANGLRVCTVENEEALSKAGISALQYNLCPTASGLVQAWQNLTDEERANLENKPAEPIYVRPPHITEAKRKPWEV